MIRYALIILCFAALTSGWVAVQVLARRMRTKNHFDDLNGGCMNCTCGKEEGGCKAEK